MSVILISRGSFSVGKALAECLARRLGYRCIDRDVIVRLSKPSTARQLAVLATPGIRSTGAEYHTQV